MAEMGNDEKEYPLLGVIMCCTSIPPEERSALAVTASQMGAVHKLDLTSDVTHLIVGDTDTPKYKFVAKERPDVKCLLPSWINAVRQSWLDGGETKVEALEILHRLPTLYGLRICVTGFDDLNYRKHLEALINDGGGEYRGNLTKDITHLIAKVPSGEKFSFAGEWGIKTVAVEWLTHTLERGMILEESLYNLHLPESERGKNAWVRKTVSTVSLGKREREQGTGPNQPRKLRRTASAKLSTQNVGLWSDIVGGGTEVEMTKRDQWDDQQTETLLQIDMLEAKRPESARSNPLFVKEEPNPRTQRTLEPNLKNNLGSRWQNAGIFQDRRFHIHGFNEEKNSILAKHLISHGAELLPDVVQLFSLAGADADHRILLVPHTMAASMIPSTPLGMSQPTVVTDMWVERCLHRKGFVNPQLNATSTPFQTFPISGFDKLVICSTAFEGVDLLHISKTVKLMGAAYNEFLTPDVSTLICNDNSSMTEKLHYAINWKIPIVATDWLWDSIRSGVLKPYDPYLIRPPCNEQQSLACRVDENQSKNNEEGPSYANSLAHNGKAFKERSLVGLKLDISEGNFSNQYNDEPDSGMFGLDPLNMPSKGFVMPTNPTNMESTEVNGQPQMDHSSQTRNSTSIPLREISSNSSPKPSPSPSKPASPPPIKPIPRHGYEEDSLGPEISSLLAHHQRSSNAAQLPSSDVPKIGRRRRQLFGRAPSGISARSTGSVSISRASSVDTMNTDGLGTPLGSGNPNAKPESKAFALLRSYSEQEEKPEAVEEPMQMTQLGYEDPDIQAWRERVVRKLGGAKELEPDKVDTGRQLKGNKVVRDMVGRGTQGVAKRTRQALGR